MFTYIRIKYVLILRINISKCIFIHITKKKKQKKTPKNEYLFYLFCSKLKFEMKSLLINTFYKQLNLK